MRIQTEPVRPIEEVSEEGVKAGIVRKPDEPTAEEWEEHMATHIPFRNWCPFCVKGQGRPDMHRSQDKGENRKPTVMLDFAYFNDDGAERGRPVLVMKDQKSKKVAGIMVPAKDSGKAIALMTREMKRLGYGSMTWKSDQEPAILTLKEKVRKELGPAYDVTMEESPAYSHQSNGEVEQAVQGMKRRVKTLVEMVQAKYGRKIEEGEDLMPWLISHATDLGNRFAVGEDGKTAYERAKGKKFGKAMVPFAEGVMALKQGTDRQVDLREVWTEGIWLGVREESMEVLIGTKDGVIKARTLKRFGRNEDRWKRSRLDEMKGTPWEPVEGSTSIDVKSQILAKKGMQEIPEVKDPAKEEPSVRRTYITRQDVEKYGMTDGCPGCIAANRKEKARPHTEECRIRLEHAMMSDQNPRWESNLKRIADEVERQVEAEHKEKRRKKEQEESSGSGIKRERPAEEDEDMESNADKRSRQDLSDLCLDILDTAGTKWEEINEVATELEDEVRENKRLICVLESPSTRKRAMEESGNSPNGTTRT